MISRQPGTQTAEPSVSATSGRNKMRPEIQVLRALAVLAVVLNHLFPGRLPGGYIGVDIFFVISGYLITAHLLRELESTGRIRLVAFWGRRARRLLPASMLVLFASAVGTVLFVGGNAWAQVMRELTASALYVQNWALAADAQDYFASAQSPSPVTHYWSLSLEEQFYLVWPLIALLAYAAGRRLGRPRAAVVLAFATIVIASLAYSVALTSSDPGSAYYVTPTRMWQLGVGGLLAMTPALVRMRHVVAVVGWAALLGSVWFFDETTPVPGWIALAPVLGAAAVIASGDAFLRTVPPLLQPFVRAAMWVGAISYSLYLWHWPPIVLLPEATGQDLTLTVRCALLVTMLVVSWLSLKFVENPLRQMRWLTKGPARRTFVPVALAMGLMLVIGQIAPGTVEKKVNNVATKLDTAATSDAPCFGARAMVNDCENPHTLRYRDSALLTTDNDPTEDVKWGNTCIQLSMKGEVLRCEFGVPEKEAKLSVALVGDSHARHWAPALDELAVEYDWNVSMMTKGSCAANLAMMRTRNFPEYIPSCEQWNKGVAEEVATDASIDVVFTSGFTRNYIIEGVKGDAAQERKRAGYQQLWRMWTESGKKVVALGDVPQMRNGDIPSCIDDAASMKDPCTTPAAKALRPDGMLVAARGDNPDVTPINLSRFFCSDGTCHSVIGGVLAYGDANHILGFFARTLAPYLDEQLREKGALPS